MFIIKKYKKVDGKCPFTEYINELLKNGCKSELVKIKEYTGLLNEYGYRLPSIAKNYAKALENDIYELRPGPIRVFYFYDKKNKCFVLLHCFRKKSDNTPKSELKLAKREKDDYEKNNR